MNRASTVDEYIVKSPTWQEELMLLRNILLTTDLEEGVKWGGPVYMIDGKNVVGMAAFKAYVGLWFHQGVFLSDPEGVLINAQKDVTKGLRQWRFTSLDEIKPALVKQYLDEAIANQRAGKAIGVAKKVDVPVAEALAKALTDPKLLEAFEKLTPARQREYKTYISEAKREETRQKRVEKVIPLILDGVALHDQYR